MSEAKFTKGCWQAGRADMATYVDGSPSKWIYAGDKYCAVASGSDIDDWQEVMANAHLIAASPDYYDEVEDLILWLGRMANLFPLGSSPLQSINARISRLQRLQTKARGEV